MFGKLGQSSSNESVVADPPAQPSAIFGFAPTVSEHGFEGQPKAPPAKSHTFGCPDQVSQQNFGGPPKTDSPSSAVFGSATSNTNASNVAFGSSQYNSTGNSAQRASIDPFGRSQYNSTGNSAQWFTSPEGFKFGYPPKNTGAFLTTPDNAAVDEESDLHISNVCENIPSTRYTWVIPNLGALNDCRIIQSPEFCIPWYKNAKFFLTITCRKEFTTGIFIGLEFEKYCETNFHVEYTLRDTKFGVLSGPCFNLMRANQDVNGKSVHSAVTHLQYTPSLSNTMFLKKKCILEFYIQLRYPFEPANLKTVIQESNTPLDTIETTENKTSVAKDLRKLFESGENSDISVVVGEVKFPAHSAILSARSPVLAKMLSFELDVQCNNEIKIVNVQPNIVKEMLRFIYCEYVEGLDKIAKELLIVAVKYEISGLLELCENYFICLMNVSNITEILTLAETSKAKELKKRCMEFIREYAKDVMNSTEFKDMLKTDAGLAQQFCLYLALQ